MPEFVTREQWGARSPRSRQRLSGTQGNTTHWEGPKMGAYSHDSCASKVRAIQNFHMDSRKWADIAYNTLTCRHGSVFAGRGYGVRSAAQGTNQGNDLSYAHCALIGVGDEVTEELKDALRWIVEDFQRLGSGTKRWTHSDWHSTACCGPALIPWTHNGMPDEIPVAPPPEERILIVNAPQVTVLSHPDWNGYLQVCSDGGVLQQGAPPFYGAAGGVKLNSPIVDADVMPDGKGYILVAADGGIFSYGSAPFKGSLGDKKLNAPIVSITITKSGQGYWLGGKDCGIFAFGDAEFKGAASYRG